MFSRERYQRWSETSRLVRQMLSLASDVFFIIFPKQNHKPYAKHVFLLSKYLNMNGWWYFALWLKFHTKKNLAMLPFFLHRGAGLWKVYFKHLIDCVPKTFYQTSILWLPFCFLWCFCLFLSLKKLKKINWRFPRRTANIKNRLSQIDWVI